MNVIRTWGLGAKVRGPYNRAGGWINLIVQNILILQETHSSVETAKQWNDEFKDQLYFSHGKTNSCGTLNAFYGNFDVVIQNSCMTKLEGFWFRK